MPFCSALSFCWIQIFFFCEHNLFAYYWKAYRYFLFIISAFIILDVYLWTALVYWSVCLCVAGERIWEIAVKHRNSQHCKPILPWDPLKKTTKLHSTVATESLATGRESPSGDAAGHSGIVAVRGEAASRGLSLLPVTAPAALTDHLGFGRTATPSSPWPAERRPLKAAAWGCTRWTGAAVRG
jgi:hypothetical protein